MLTFLVSAKDERTARAIVAQKSVQVYGAAPMPDAALSNE
jgi:hypothetical protein